MLSIIITYNNINNSLENISNYIKHIHNINKNINLKIHIIILSCNYNISNIILDFEINENIKVDIFNYKTDYNDSIHNELIQHTLYDYILYTDLETYLTEPILEYISLNKINENGYLRTNVIKLNKIPNEFYENYSNNIFNSIAENISILCNENNENKITSNEFINEFNKNNNNIIHISNENIEKHKLHYINHVNHFLLIHKNLILKYGFNITNTNNFYTNSYILLNLIRNKYNMYKLPITLSVYIKNNTNIIPIIDENIKIKTSREYNKNINYKIYNFNNNKEKSFIRNHIKQLTGIHSNDLIKKTKNIEEENKKLIEENKKLIEENKKLIEENNILKKQKIEKNETINETINEKKIKEKLKIENIKLKKKFKIKLDLLNIQINELIIKQKNKIKI